MNSDFWEQFYKAHTVPDQPSAFAASVLSRFETGDHILDIGCGNGRDSLFFASQGHQVSAIDQVQTQSFPEHALLSFYKYDLNIIDQVSLPDYDVAYARFLFHAVSRETTHTILNALQGRLFAEFRAAGDKPLIYPNHERVLWEQEEFEMLLHQYGYEIISFDAAYGRAVFGEEDPLILRLEAVKL